MTGKKKYTATRPYTGVRALKQGSKTIKKRVRGVRREANVFVSVGSNDGFASTKQYVEAVEKIYMQEIADIERFVKHT